MREIPSPTMPFAGLGTRTRTSPSVGGRDTKQQPAASGAPHPPDLHPRITLFRKKRCWIARVFGFTGR